MGKSRLVVVVALAVVALCNLQASAQGGHPPEKARKKEHLELNTVLMQCTFEIEGRNAEGQNSIGTAFVIGRPIPSAPNMARYVLVTAGHVLSDIATDSATLYLRRRVGTNNWVPEPTPIPIRAHGRPLWTKHPSADVAVMYVKLPTDVSLPLLTTDFLADDAVLSHFAIHPGDELECLGYPLGFASNSARFPVLRSGRVASYPLLPTSAIETFLLDFRVFKGNSGGPVYFVQTNRFYGNTVHLGQTVSFIVGLVSAEKVLPLPITGPYEQGLREVQLGLAVVVDASLIKQTIEMLPPP